jgi:hypothetical protein
MRIFIFVNPQEIRLFVFSGGDLGLKVVTDVEKNSSFDIKEHLILTKRQLSYLCVSYIHLQCYVQ